MATCLWLMAMRPTRTELGRAGLSGARPAGRPGIGRGAQAHVCWLAGRGAPPPACCVENVSYPPPSDRLNQLARTPPLSPQSCTLHDESLLIFAGACARARPPRASHDTTPFHSTAQHRSLGRPAAPARARAAAIPAPGLRARRRGAGAARAAPACAPPNRVQYACHDAPPCNSYALLVAGSRAAVWRPCSPLCAPLVLTAHVQLLAYFVYRRARDTLPTLRQGGPEGHKQPNGPARPAASPLTRLVCRRRSSGALLLSRAGMLGRGSAGSWAARSALRGAALYHHHPPRGREEKRAPDFSRPLWRFEDLVFLMRHHCSDCLPPLPPLFEKADPTPLLHRPSPHVCNSDGEIKRKHAQSMAEENLSRAGCRDPLLLTSPAPRMWTAGRPAAARATARRTCGGGGKGGAAAHPLASPVQMLCYASKTLRPAGLLPLPSPHGTCARPVERGSTPQPLSESGSGADPCAPPAALSVQQHGPKGP